MALKVKRSAISAPRTRPHHDKRAQWTYNRERRKQSLQRMMSSLTMLMILAVGAGVAYTWYMGQQQTALANQPAPERKSRPIIKPHKVSSGAPIGVATQTITDSVKPGDNASLNVRTNPEANCTIVVKYGTVDAVDSGLKPTKADEFGIASWAWTVPKATPEGASSVEVTCKNKKYSAVLEADVRVKS